jgi:uncharacterized protein (DUF58 family)
MSITSIFLFPKSIKLFLKTNFERWLAKRIPCNREHQLNSRNIMIYPTRFGLTYLGFVVLIFLLGTNYQNNIILLFSYLLASLFISVMLHSFYNFSKIRFYSVAEQQGFSESIVYFPVKIMTEKIRYDINIHFTDALLNSQTQKVSQCHQGSYEIKLPYKPVKRGKYYLGRVTIFSEYSLGIFKSKTVLDFGHNALIYPKPKKLIAGQYQLSSQPDEPRVDSNNTVNTAGTDDFYELKSFVRGESQARTAWKQLAKGQGHFSKHYQASQGQLQWLKLSEMPSSDIEDKLAYLSFLIVELSAANQSFGLDLSSDSMALSENMPTNQLANIAPNSGVSHQHECLTALALYS